MHAATIAGGAAALERSLWASASSAAGGRMGGVVMASKTISADTRAKLLDGIEVLKSVQPETFDMRVWQNACGTAGCFAYHYVSARPNIGLKYKDCGTCIPVMVPEFLGRTGFAALQLYFGISEEDAEHLFDQDHYGEQPLTPQMVIDRIRDFLGEPVSDEERGAMMEGDRFDGLA